MQSVQSLRTEASLRWVVSAVQNFVGITIPPANVGVVNPQAWVPLTTVWADAVSTGVTHLEKQRRVLG